MEANELRIGNFISYPLNTKKNPVVVTGVIRHKIYTDSFEGDAECFFPIPLTEEWLIKFGFEQYYEDNDAYPTYHFENFIVDDKFQPIDVGFKITDYEIKHVYQLQNLFFALKGKELTLK